MRVNQNRARGIRLADCEHRLFEDRAICGEFDRSQRGAEQFHAVAFARAVIKIKPCGVADDEDTLSGHHAADWRRRRDILACRAALGVRIRIQEETWAFIDVTFRLYRT